MTNEVLVDTVCDMRVFAERAVHHGLCGRLFPEFIRGIQQDEGREPSADARRMANHIESCAPCLSPDEVASLLLLRANEIVEEWLAIGLEVRDAD